MASGRVDLPTDDELREMSGVALDSLAVGLSEGENERLSDALLRIHGGTAAAAHSEDRQIWRNRRIVGHEVSLGAVEATGAIQVPISEEAIRGIINRAANAGLSRDQETVWILHEAGYSQCLIGEQLGVSQQRVSQVLCVAREALWWQIDTNGDAYQTFLQETRRHVYHRPSSKRKSKSWTKIVRGQFMELKLVG